MKSKSRAISAKANEDEIDIPGRLLHLQDDINDVSAAVEFYLLAIEALAGNDRLNSLTLRQRNGLGVMGGFIVEKSAEHISTLEEIRADLQNDHKQGKTEPTPAH